MHDAFRGLPDLVLAIAPELKADGWPEETLATCERCPVASAVRPVPHWALADDLRCCTFHPGLPNFLVGRLLREGNALMRARLADPDGVSLWGVEAGVRWRALRERTGGAEGFGRAAETRCPYWVGGEHACGIHAHRGAVCRTWFCRRADGPEGAERWSAAKDLLLEAEKQIAAACVKDLSPDDEPTEAWFIRCADHVDDNGPALGMRLASRLDDARARMRRAKPRPPLPDVVRPAVQRMEWVGDVVVVGGYARWDQVHTRADVFVLLNLLDGRPWRQAVVDARADDAEVDEALVRELWRVGALEG